MPPPSSGRSAGAEGRTIPLTEDQLDALRWIDRNDSHHSGWMTKGKPARGKPATWDALKCEGPRGSIIIPVADWEAIRSYVTCGIGTDRDRSIHILNEAGREALAEGRPASSGGEP